MELDSLRPLTDEWFLTPQLVVDGRRLAFVGTTAAGRETEAFATLLTFATFAERTEQVIDEVYSEECARTGFAARLDEERWYEVAKEYFDEFTTRLQHATAEELRGHYLWLEEHFFGKHRGYDALRALIERVLASRSALVFH